MIRFMKAAPTTYVMQFKHGRVKREGPGLSFHYFGPTSTIVAVPLGSVDVPFVFHESTSDFQTVTVQGQLTYRVVEPRLLATLLDYSLLPNGKYASDDPQKLSERLVAILQTATRNLVERLSLKDALMRAEVIAKEALGQMQNVAGLKALGVEVMNLAILALRPTPEMQKALEAEAREALQRQSDEAIYARRNAAMVEERHIKETELSTEIAVEEKRRQIRETQMAADIAVEEQRAQLIDQRVQNERKDADAKAYALETSLKPISEVDWRKLMFLNQNGGDPRAAIAMAFQELAGNAAKIGELNISPDLLRALIGERESE